jgi:type IV pilus assembly protein PilY1
MSTQANVRRKVLACVVASAIGLNPIALSAHAAGSADISDVPLPVKNRVAPNIMLSLDNSTSMGWETLGTAECCADRTYPRPPAPAANRVPNFNETNVHNLLVRSAHNNKQFYNPDVTYRPWIHADGTPWPQANPRAAFYSPQDPGAGSLDLLALRTEPAQWFSDAGTGNPGVFECDPAPCGAEHSYWPITYYKYNGSGNILARSSYTRVEIRSTTPSSTLYSYKLRDGTTATRTRAQEIENFANWFVYHRSRMASARAGTSRAFSTLGEAPRIGLAATGTGARTIDGVLSGGGIERGVRAFTGTDRAAVFDLLFHLPLISGTPLRRLADDVGVYFSRSDALGPWAAQPGVGGEQVSCRQNFHILVTDGGWTNQSARNAGARQNVDGTAGPPTPHRSAPDPVTNAVTSFTYTPASPYRDDWSNTLADVAMYYWLNDLRPDLANNVFTSDNNPAFWQHLSTYTVAFGAFGRLSKAELDAVFSASPPTNFVWPDPHASEAARIDDVAHAALNGRGAFYSAADPEEFAIALAAALDNIGARTSAGAAVGISSPILAGSNDLLFASSYMPGFTWSGELAAFAIDPDTGVPGATPVWTAQGKLDGRAQEDRMIVSYDGSRGVHFRPPGNGNRTLTGEQRNRLSTPGVTPGDGDVVIRYLRGETAGEHQGVYRRRAHLLGDIVNAQPLLVSPPAQTYGDPGYAAFKSARANRGRIVLQGANDGMLHAFDAADGKELWAYVPTFLFPNLNNLTRRLGYTHKFYVDATPFAGDVDFSRTSGVSAGQPPDWRTIVVGGLGKGGRGFYALDVTETQARDETDAANKVLWEFPSAHPTHVAVRANVGYSFGRPVTTKTRAEGWVVLVTSGYNNGSNPGDSGGDGRGYLFVLNARTGALIRAIETPNAGSPDNPSGFAHIAAYAAHASVDNTVDYVYGGDLLGNVWRFDLSGNRRDDWKVSRLARLVDADGATQPVTTEPELARIRIGNKYTHFVYVGTGRFLGDTDIPDAPGANRGATQTQTIYGLVDDLTGMEITDLRRNLLRQTLTDTADRTGNRVASSNDLDFTRLKGWYVDLPGVGERITAPPALATGTLVFTSNIPSSDPCVLGGHAYYNLLDYRTGGYRVGEPTLPSSIRINRHGLASGITLVKTKNGIRGIVRTSAAETFVGAVPRTGAGAETKRRLWKELRR